MDIDHETTGCSYVVCFEKGTDDSSGSEETEEAGDDEDVSEEAGDAEDLPPS